MKPFLRIHLVKYIITYVEDSVFEDDNQIMLTTYRKLEESITNNGEEEKQQVKDDIDGESITEGSVAEEKKCVADDAEKEKTEAEIETIAVGRNDAAATTKPTPLPYTMKWQKV